MRVTTYIVAVLLAVFWWRNGRSFRNVVAPVKHLPVEYFSKGEARSKCKIIRDPSSDRFKFCEDAIFWDVPAGKLQKGTERKLLLSCDANRLDWNTVMGPLRNGTGSGSLWVYSPTSDGLPVQIMLNDYSSDNGFHPLGINVLPSDPTQLLVVNHGVQKSTIEHFKITLTSPYKASHIRTYSDPKIISPNSVAWTSPSSFYITQDHRLTRRLPHVLGSALPLLETVFLPGITELSHAMISNSNKVNVTSAVSRLAFPNGVSISPSGGKVAVASSSCFTVSFYNRDPLSNSLTFNTSVEVPMAPDNVHFVDDETLTVAGHPNFIALSAVAAGKKGVLPPSWVLSLSPRIKPLSAGKIEDGEAPVPASQRARASSAYELKTLYQSNGAAFGGSTTALWDQRTENLFVVGLYQEGLLSCSG